MVDKRAAKLSAMAAEIEPPKAYHGDSKTLLVGWGATQGALMEAVDKIRSEGQDVGCLSFRDLWPFPADAAQTMLSKAESFVMVEGNGTAQLGQIIRAQTGLKAAGAILKYDGRPFFPKDILEGFNKHLG